jgi:hypothetical protein
VISRKLHKMPIRANAETAEIIPAATYGGAGSLSFFSGYLPWYIILSIGRF